MKAFEILEEVLKNTFTNLKKINPVLPEFYSGAGSEWCYWVDDIRINRSDGKKYNALLESRGVSVVYCTSMQKAIEVIDLFLEAFSVSKILNINIPFVCVTLERMQVINVRNVVAVLATCKIIEEE